MKTRWLIGGLAAVLVLGAGGAFVGGALPSPAALFKRDKPKKPEVPLEFLANELVRPVNSTMAQRVEFSGPLVAPNTALLRARARGTLAELKLAEGHRVSAGQVVGRIDIADQASRLAERAAAVEAARAALAQAERSQASNERLAAQSFISPIALDSSRAATETARAQLAQATALLETTRVALDDATLSAPIAGIVAKRHALPGEKLNPDQPVLTIVDLARLELAGHVGTHQISRLAAGMTVEVEIEGAPAPLAGRIARIAPAAEAGTRSIGVTVELDNAKQVFRAGQYAIARVELPDATKRLTLPATAVGSTGGQPHVWVIDGGVLARRAVTLGREDAAAGRVEVLGGIDPGAQVLAAGFNNLKEGRKALVVGDRPRGGSSSAPATAAMQE
ncbi:efflux RND transporter periplasmic adaptor subunit [Piscinibacter sakaiensis]|uniref:efflux RND transporter periplasmic adaptor subunit n=1 Tax=Piscinibacter sakaiensis TaxID=1547922 RepID=UPI003AAD5A36